MRPSCDGFVCVCVCVYALRSRTKKPAVVWLCTAVCGGSVVGPTNQYQIITDGRATTHSDSSIVTHIDYEDHAYSISQISIC